MVITALSESTVRALGSSQSIAGPSSVIKELVDNALDAHATNITISIHQDTLSHVQVRDNGTGVPPSDRPLLAAAHCTSKLTAHDELSTIGPRSLGYRGQALNLIAEMSKSITITTRIEGEDPGTCLCFNRDGTLASEQRKSHAVGTTVQVEDFLAHFPVRKLHMGRNTLKTMLDIREMLHRYAVARPGLRLAFSVSKGKGVNDRWMYAGARGDTLLDAAAKLFGRSIKTQVASHVVEAHGVKITAILPLPTQGVHVKGGGHHSYVSVDGRPLTTGRGLGKDLVKLVKQHFSRVANGTPALICINVETEGVPYDVNIEPGKDDVLFEDGQIIEKVLESMLQGIYAKQAGETAPDMLDLVQTRASSEDTEGCHGTESYDATVQPPRETFTGTESSVFGEMMNPAEEEQAVRRDITISNPWVIAKLNALRPSRASIDQPAVTKPSDAAPVSHPNIRASLDTSEVAPGPLTPDPSPPRRLQQTSLLDQRVCDWNNIPRLYPHDIAEVDTASSIAEDGARDGLMTPASSSPVRHQQAGVLGDLYTSIGTVHAPVEITQFVGNHSLPFPSPSSVVGDDPDRRQAQPVITRTRNVRLPFKSPVNFGNKKNTRGSQGREQVDPAREAWFDIPDMRRDQQRRRDRRQRAEQDSQQGFYDLVNGTAQNGTSDIRSFMRPRPTPSDTAPLNNEPESRSASAAGSEIDASESFLYNDSGINMSHPTFTNGFGDVSGVHQGVTLTDRGLGIFSAIAARSSEEIYNAMPQPTSEQPYIETEATRTVLLDTPRAGDDVSNVGGVAPSNAAPVQDTVSATNDPRLLLLRPRTKSNTLRRTKSSMLPLERTPIGAQTQRLCCALDYKLRQDNHDEQVKSVEDITMALGGDDAIENVFTMSVEDTQMLVRNLRCLLHGELVENFDEIVTAALLLTGTEELDDDASDGSLFDEEMLL